MYKLLFAFLFTASLNLATAQTEIIGIVFDLETSQPLPSITVKNISTNEEADTDGNGNFVIPGKINDLLALSGPGYQTDTVFYYEEGTKRIFLTKDESTIVINEVYVTRFTDSRLAYEIDRAKIQGQALEASQNRGGLRISPSRLFGKAGKNARNDLEILLEERDNRKIDRVFTNQLIRSMLPLTEQELPLFRAAYRPSVEFIETSSIEDVKAYINDSYRKFRSEQHEKLKD